MTNVLLLEFVAGAWLGAWVLSGRVPGWALGRPALLSGLGLAVAGFLAAPAVRDAGVPDVAVFGAPSFLLVATAVLAELSGAGAAFRRRAWLGDSSYALHLIHVLVILLALPVLAPLVTGWVSLAGLVLLLTAASLAAGLALHGLVERPLLRRLGPMMPGRGRGRAAVAQGR